MSTDSNASESPVMQEGDRIGREWAQNRADDETLARFVRGSRNLAAPNTYHQRANRCPTYVRAVVQVITGVVGYDSATAHGEWHLIVGTDYPDAESRDFIAGFIAGAIENINEIFYWQGLAAGRGWNRELADQPDSRLPPVMRDMLVVRMRMYGYSNSYCVLDSFLQGIIDATGGEGTEEDDYEQEAGGQAPIRQTRPTDVREQSSQQTPGQPDTATPPPEPEPHPTLHGRTRSVAVDRPEQHEST